MPILPSGLSIGIGYQAIPEDMGTNWFKCQEGHFWYKRPDVTITPPPYDGTTNILEDWVHAPVPKNTEEVKQYLYVLYQHPDGRFQWRGDWLNKFPQPGQLDETDWKAWNVFLTDEKGQGFLQKAIDHCARQAELNRLCSGYAIFTDNQRPLFIR